MCPLHGKRFNVVLFIYFLYALPDLCRLRAKYIFHLDGSVVTMAIDEKEILEGIIIIYTFQENKMVKTRKNLDIIECFQGGMIAFV